jgi:hypothetical protein
MQLLSAAYGLGTAVTEATSGVACVGWTVC